jgi:hypothetical protein
MNKKLSLLEPGSDRAKELSGVVREINRREDTLAQLNEKTINIVCDWATERILQGHALIKAKELVPHGDWELWLASNCPLVKKRNAQRYMAEARKATNVSLTPVDALRDTIPLLCGDNEKGGNESGEVKRFPDWMIPPNECGRLCSKLQPYISGEIQVPKEGEDKMREELDPVVKKLWPGVRFA